MIVPTSPQLVATGPYIPVYVPESRLGEIYRLLGTEPSASAAGVERPGVSLEPVDDEWSGTADERFSDRDFVDAHLVPRSQTVREAARYLAQRPGQWISSDEIAAALALEHGWNSLAGAFGAAGRYFANREIDLPWDWTYDTPDRRIRIRMDANVAKAVLEAI